MLVGRPILDLVAPRGYSRTPVDAMLRICACGRARLRTYCMLWNKSNTKQLYNIHITSI